MSQIPTSPRAAVLTWAQAHAPVWATGFASIGISTAQASAYTAGVTALSSAITAQESAKQAALVSTQNALDRFNELKALQGDLIRTIRAFAENSAKPSTVYAAAQIPAPAIPSPAPAPAQPTKLAVSLNAASGAVQLSWKAANPAGTSGTSYIIRRKLPGETAFSFVGVTGSKKFTDETLFAGPDSVQYTVQGQRSDASGPLSEVFIVNFGRLPGGGFNAFVTTDGEQTAKLAA